jgi:Putative zinc ribbon domain
MPFSKDEKGGGTEANGSKSTDYCSCCYRMGQFTERDLTSRSNGRESPRQDERNALAGLSRKEVHEGHPKPEAMDVESVCRDAAESVEENQDA